MMSRTVSCETGLVDKTEMPPITFSMGGRIPSQSSVVSNISSIYEKYTMHINIIKGIGVVVLLALMSTSLALTSGMIKNSAHYNYTDCKKIKGAEDYKSSGINNISCGYLKQFDLPEQYKVTICTHQKQVWIGIRHFIGNITSGIFLNKRQWNYLLRIRSTINQALKRADNANRS